MQTKVTKIAGYTVVEFSGVPATLDLDSYADDHWADEYDIVYDDIVTYDNLIEDQDAAIAKLSQAMLDDEDAKHPMENCHE